MELWFARYDICAGGKYPQGTREKTCMDRNFVLNKVKKEINLLRKFH